MFARFIEGAAAWNREQRLKNINLGSACSIGVDSALLNRELPGAVLLIISFYLLRSKSLLARNTQRPQHY